MPTIKKLRMVLGWPEVRTTRQLVWRIQGIEKRATLPLGTPSFPEKITGRVAEQARGAGFRLRDGIPVSGPMGTKTYTTGEVDWKFGDDGVAFVVTERMTWNQQRDISSYTIVDQPLTLSDDRTRPASSMFAAWVGWLNYGRPEWKTKRLERCRGLSPEVAAKQVAWIQGGEIIYRTTMGALIKQALELEGLGRA